MQKLLFLLASLLLTWSLQAQKIEGQITDKSGEGIIGVNVYLDGTYDGASTDINGNFSFLTTEKDSLTLVVSAVGFKIQRLPIFLRKEPLNLKIELKEEVNQLSGVTITAGSFEASDEKKAVILKPLDIAMTAGATADIVGALNTLPGTTTNGESGRLFVRGGTDAETQAFIDGVLVHSFYGAAPNNVPSRSRFSPFLFKGTFFSSGGYSAEYGQALSSVLSLTSNDIPDETRTDISLMTVGTDVAHTQKWENGSIYGQVQYTNLDPYNSLINQEYKWEKGFTSVNSTFMLRQKLTKNDMLKVYANIDQSGFTVNFPNIDSPELMRVDLTNKNLYLNSSYQRAIGENSNGYIGASYGKTVEDLMADSLTVNDVQEGYHFKTNFTTDISQVTLKVGGEIMGATRTEDAAIPSEDYPEAAFENTITSGFVEADYYVSNSLTLRTGLRAENYSLLSYTGLTPRLSMALKTGDNSQLSLAYGKFNQLPTGNILIRSTQVIPEKADHYIVSFQKIKSSRIFRAEVYRKDYRRLVKFDQEFDANSYTNKGRGYAQGVDLFYRDGKSIKNGDFWITYSYLDTKRDFLNYPKLAQPSFAANHNFSIVYKHFITRLKTQIGAAYRFNSGRPYDDPNSDQFNSGTTKNFGDLSFNFAYLHRQNIILYASATNLLGRNNVFGYEFEQDPGADNVYDSRPITQPAKRFLFVGLFITLTKDKSKNNLQNLN